ncbi:MAG: DMT family transporter [Myxococcaceae bacterium]|nr:DMT family transporter [Myxococcaceae bacterium]
MVASATLVLSLCTLIWGLTFVVVKDALAASDPFTFLTLRFALGAVACLAWARGRVLDRTTLTNGLGLGLVLFAGYAFQTFGLDDTTPSRSAFITGLAVIGVPFLSWGLSRTAMSWAPLAGAAIAIAGLARLTGFGPDEGLSRGDLLTLACAASYALHIALTGKLARDGASVALVAVQLTTVAVLSALCIPLGAPRFHPTPTYWAAVAATGLIASALAISIQTWAQTRTTAARAAVIFSLEPVVALAASVALGRESPGLAELSGGALIIAGVLVSELGSLWRAPAVRPAPATNESTG